MDENIKSLKRVEYIEGISIILIGAIFIAFSPFIASFFSIILGILILVGGVALVSNCLLENRYMAMPILRLTIGFLMVVLGISSFINPAIMMSFTSNIVGTIVLIIGIYKLVTAISAHKSGRKSLLIWIEAAINLIFALFMFWFPLDANSLIIIIIGCYLIYFGITFLISIKKATLYMTSTFK